MLLSEKAIVLRYAKERVSDRKYSKYSITNLVIGRPLLEVNVFFVTTH